MQSSVWVFMQLWHALERSITTFSKKVLRNTTSVKKYCWDWKSLGPNLYNDDQCNQNGHQRSIISPMDGATSHHASSAYNLLLIFIVNRHNLSLNKLWVNAGLLKNVKSSLQMSKVVVLHGVRYDCFNFKYDGHPSSCSSLISWSEEASVGSLCVFALGYREEYSFRSNVRYGVYCSTPQQPVASI